MYYLSPDDPADANVLEKARFVKPGDSVFSKVEDMYTLGCKEMLANTRHEIEKELRKLWPF